MKKFSSKAKSVVKGAPSGLVISILVHAGAFLLAGMLVVFTVNQRKEQKFAPPKPVERPKMKLKKPKVKVKKNAKPKATTRIVTKVQKADMPDIQLPELGGMGTGLEGGAGLGGFEMLPNLNEVSLFGGKITTGNELKGYFYNFNRDRRGTLGSMSPESLVNLLSEFMKSGWKKAKLARYFRSVEALYTPTICVPTVLSELAPKAFGMNEAEGYCWGVLYEGSIVYPEDITFRFWGVGDKVLAVNVGGETVLICAYKAEDRALFSSIWDTNEVKDNTYFFGEHRARPGDWISLKAGEAKDIKVLLADTNGGLVYHILSVEVKGQEYPMTRGGGGPTFPVFRTGVIPRDMRDVIYSNLYPGDTCLTNGPIFSDIISYAKADSSADAATEPEVQDEVSTADEDSAIRIWKLVDGKEIEARFLTLVGNQAVLEGAKRKHLKIPLDQLSPEDRVFIEFALPPKLDINFFKKSKQVPNPPVSPWVGANQRPLQIFSYTFGARVKQTSSGEYKHELAIEYFAVGEEVDGNNYVLLDRGTSSFVPSDENKKNHEFFGDGVEIMRIAYRDGAPMRGTKYGGYLVIVRDERGRIIQYDASHKFLYEHLNNLRKLKPHNHFDDNCIRTIPARPTEDSRGPGAVDGN